MAPVYFNKGEPVGGGSFDERALSEVEKELLYNYQRSYERIKTSLQKFYEANVDGSGTMTYSSGVQDRLEGLYTSIGNELAALSAKADGITQEAISDVMGSAYGEISDEIAGVIERVGPADAGMQFGGLNTEAVRAAVRNPLYLSAVESNASSALVEVKREIAQGIINGDSYFKIAGKIKERIDVSASKALTIARTESGKAYSAGQLKAHEEAEELGVIMHKVWVSTLDLRTRDSHRHMDQQVADKEGYFRLPGGYRVKGPRLGGPAKEVVNCRCRMISVVEGYEPETRIAREGTGNMPVEYQTYDEWDQTRTRHDKWAVDNGLAKKVDYKNLSQIDRYTINATLYDIKNKYKNFPTLSGLSAMTSPEYKALNAEAQDKDSGYIRIGSRVKERFSISRLKADLKNEKDPVKISMIQKTIESISSGRYDYHKLHSTYTNKSIIEGTVAHEAGHILHYNNKKIIDKFFKDSYTNGVDWKKQYAITERAEFNMKECFAENFALFHAGKKEFLHPDMLALMDGLLL